MAKNVQNQPQNATFLSVRGPNRCYIDNRPLCFHKMAPSKIIRAQEGILTLQSVPLTTKLAWMENAQNHPKNITFRSGMGSDSCHISNQPLYFHQMTLSKVIRAQVGIPMSQNVSPTTRTAWIGKKRPKSSQNITLRSIGGTDRCCIGNQPLFFF